MALLWALFFRPVGFEFRNQTCGPALAQNVGLGTVAGSAVPALIFGVAFGNLLQGVPFHFDEQLVPHYTGSFFGLLNPFALLAGVVSVAMLVFHGANYLMHRTEGEISVRARRASVICGMVLIGAFTLAGLWVASLPGYLITAGAAPGGAPNPLAKEVAIEAGAWLNNYSAQPLTSLLPALAYVGALAGLLLAWRGKGLAAFVASAVAIAGVIATAGAAMFPFLMPSSSEPRSSLTIWDSTSSQFTLGLMFWAAVIFMPIVVFYTGWAYRVMRGKVTAAYVRENEKSAY